MVITNFSHILPLDKKVALPFYKQIYGRFRDVIDSGVLKPGDRIPSARALAQESKLTFEAQFSEFPFETAEKAYAQIVKAVTQLWQFFSLTRTEKYTGRKISKTAHGVVLTIDSWMQMSQPLHAQVFAQAKQELASRFAIA